MTEFELIRDYFSARTATRPDVAVGIGDDCALLRVPAGSELAVSVDTLVAGVHFLSDCDPEALGHKCLAVGLSDLAAVGAEPAWATLALTLPRPSERWLRGFAEGFCALAQEYGMALVGGDTTRGPLSISVQVHGLLAAGRGVRRSGARRDESVCVSGTLGDAGLALRLLKAGGRVAEGLRARLERPRPRVRLGMALRGLASAMIDVSDGLAADLGHVLSASGVGAEVRLSELPLSPQVAARVVETGDWSLPVTSGDDYELCFTLPAAHRGELGPLAARTGCPVRAIGRVTEAPGLTFLLPDGSRWFPAQSGYDHFADDGPGHDRNR